MDDDEGQSFALLITLSNPSPRGFFTIVLYIANSDLQHPWPIPLASGPCLGPYSVGSLELRHFTPARRY